jgi:peptide/nickel transport system permease protein
LRLLLQSLGFWRTRIGFGLIALVVLIALVGPAFAPHSPTALVGAPFQAPSSASPLGTDYLGEDVLSRLLWGGRTVVWMSVMAATLALIFGVTIGMTAGYSRSRLDDLLMRTMDVLLALPAIVLALTVVSLIGPNPWLIVGAVAWSWIPAVARISRGATVEVVRREHIEAVQALGVPTRRILFGEVLPNIATPIMVDYGLRLTWATATIAALSFIGAGIQPPNADWGLMISQNRSGLTLQAWSVLAPALCIGLFALGTNMVAEGFARTASLVDRKEDGQ